MGENDFVEVVIPQDGLFNPNYRMENYKGFSLDGSETYSVYGSYGSEIIKTGYQNDLIFGNSGDDWIAGGGGHCIADASARCRGQR